MKPLLALPGVRSLGTACALLAAPVALLVVAQWAFVARFVNAVFREGAFPAATWPWLAWLAFTWALRAGLVGLRDVLGARRASAVKRDLRARLYAKLLRLGPAFTAGERGGELAETLIGGVEKLDAFVGRFVPLSAFALVVPALLAATVLFLDPLSGLILVLTGPLIVLLLWLVGSLAGQAAREQWLVLGRLGAGFVDTLRGLSSLVVYGRAGARLRALNELDDAYRRTTLRVLRTAFLSGGVLELGATLSTALVAVTVGVRLFEGQLPFERAFLVLLLTPEFYAPLRAVGGEHHASLEARAAAGRLFALLDAPEPPKGTLPVPEGPLRVELRQVSLSYQERVALSGVSLALPPLSTTALVGHSGAGKSSVARLVLGFATPSAGEVLVNGVRLADLDPEAWRAKVAYLPERPFLFAASVRDNIALGRPNAAPSEVEGAARAAGAHDFIARLPRGYDTLLGEDGVNLSGGERVRLALARAFLKDAPLLILDEPSAHLDAASEAELRGVLGQLRQGRTVLTITHRAALRGEADRTVELADGRIVSGVDGWVAP